MRSPPVSRTAGRRGRVTLLLKNPDQPIHEANLRGINISYHISKLEPTAFYALATAKCEGALGGPCLVGGMRGVSILEVVRRIVYSDQIGHHTSDIRLLWTPITQSTT